MGNEIMISKANILAQYQPIASPMKIELEVTGSPSKSRWVNPRLKSSSRGASYSHSFFINFKAIDARKAQSMLAKFEEYGGEEMPIIEFKFGLTKEIIVHHTDEEPKLPASGEKVQAILDFAKDKEGNFVKDQNNEKILEVKEVIIPEAKKSSGLSWDTFTTKTKRKSIVADDSKAEAKASAKEVF